MYIFWLFWLLVFDYFWFWLSQDCNFNWFFSSFISYSLISMKLIHYFDTWAIIWRGIIPVFLKICKKFAVFAHKIVFGTFSVAKLFRNNNKNNFASKCCKFLANLQNSWNNMVSNVVLITEYMDLSHSFSCIGGISLWNCLRIENQVLIH